MEQCAECNPCFSLTLGFVKVKTTIPISETRRLRPRETTQVQAEGVNSLLPSKAAGVPQAASPTTSAKTRPLQPGPAGPSQNLLESVNSPSALPDSTQECAQTPTAPVGKLRGDVGPYPRPLPGLWMLTDAQTPDAHSEVGSSHQAGRPTGLPRLHAEDVASLQVSPQTRESGGPGEQPLGTFPGPHPGLRRCHQTSCVAAGSRFSLS